MGRSAPKKPIDNYPQYTTPEELLNKKSSSSPIYLATSGNHTNTPLGDNTITTHLETSHRLLMAFDKLEALVHQRAEEIMSSSSPVTEKKNHVGEQIKMYKNLKDAFVLAVTLETKNDFTEYNKANEPEKSKLSEKIKNQMNKVSYFVEVAVAESIQGKISLEEVTKRFVHLVTQEKDYKREVKFTSTESTEIYDMERDMLTNNLAQQDKTLIPFLTAFKQHAEHNANTIYQDNTESIKLREARANVAHDQFKKALELMGAIVKLKNTCNMNNPVERAVCKWLTVKLKDIAENGLARPGGFFDSDIVLSLEAGEKNPDKLCRSMSMLLCAAEQFMRTQQQRTNIIGRIFGRTKPSPLLMEISSVIKNSNFEAMSRADSSEALQGALADLRTAFQKEPRAVASTPQPANTNTNRNRI